MTEPMLLRPTAQTRRINDLIWKSLGDDDDAGRPLAFFCECGREECYLPVWLTPVGYERRRRLPDWVALAPAHRRSRTG